MKLLRFLYPWRYWLLAWLMGVGLMYLVSWPACLYRLADDEMFEASSHDGTYLATRQLRQDDPSVGIGAPRERDAKLLIRKASSGWLYRTIESDSVRISSVEFANHDSHVVAQCDNRVVAWNVSTGKQTLPATPGHLHSVTRAPADAQWAVILLSDDLSAAEWKLRYNGVAFVDIASGETISTLQPFNLHKGPWSVPGLAIAPDGQRAVAISLAPQVQEDEESPLQYTVWDTRSGTIIGKFEDSSETDPYNRNERMYPRSWTLSSDSKQLWLLFAEYSELSNKGIAYLHAWNLETLRLEKRLVEESRGDVLIALGNAYTTSFLSDRLLLVETTSAKFLLEVSDESLSCIAVDGMSNVVSSDGSLWAKEAGEIVDAAPPFAYQIKGRRLSVVSTSNGEEVASIAGPSEEVTSQSVFDPLGFTADGRYLIYEQYRDSKWAKVRSTLSDLVNWRTTEAEMRPLEIRCLEVQSGQTRLVGLPVRDVVAGGEMLPGDRIKRGDEVWDVPGHKPWLAILLVPLVPLLIAYRLIERRRRRTSGTTAASVEPVA